MQEISVYLDLPASLGQSVVELNFVIRAWTTSRSSAAVQVTACYAQDVSTHETAFLLLAAFRIKLEVQSLFWKSNQLQICEPVMSSHVLIAQTWIFSQFTFL